MTENLSNCKKINQIFPTNFSDICSRESQILLIFQEILVYFFENLPHNLPKIFSKFLLTLYEFHFQNFQNILLKNFINNRSYVKLFLTNFSKISGVSKISSNFS